jgi:molybdate transport system substrate-binding protein
MAKIKVMSAGAVEGPVSELAPEFTRASGHEVELHFNTVGAHKERFVGGEKTDVIILSFPVIEALDKEGRFVAGSRVDLGRASCGVAVRDGMMMPNISTVEGFKRMLKFAASIAANDPAHGGSSGIYLADLLKRMGLYDEVSPKLCCARPAAIARCAPARRGGDRHHLHQRVRRGPGHAGGRPVAEGDRIRQWLRRCDRQGCGGRAGDAHSCHS